MALRNLEIPLTCELSETGIQSQLVDMFTPGTTLGASFMKTAHSATFRFIGWMMRFNDLTNKEIATGQGAVERMTDQEVRADYAAKLIRRFSEMAGSARERGATENAWFWERAAWVVADALEDEEH